MVFFKITQQELQKFIKSFKNKVILFLVLLLVSLFQIYVVNLERTYYDKQALEYNAERDRSTSAYRQSLSTLEIMEEDTRTTDKEKEQMTLQAEYFRRKATMARTLNHYYTQGDSMNLSHYRTNQNNYYTLLLNGKKNNLEHFKIPEEELKNQIELNAYILNHSLEIPINPYKTTAVNHLYLTVSSPLKWGVLLLILISILDIFLDELRGHSYKLLYSQPLKRMSIFSSKILISILTLLIYIALAISLAWLWGFLLGETGDWQMPMSITENGDVLTIGNHIITHLLILLTLSFSLMAAMVICGVFFQETTSSCALFILLILSGIFFGRNLSDFSMWYPYAYVLPALVSSGKIHIGLVSNLIIGTLLFYFATLTFNQKDLTH